MSAIAGSPVRGLKPTYAFGQGLSYTSFDYADFAVTGGARVTAHLTVRNAGAVTGADVPQLYLQSIDGRAAPRLLGFQRVGLAPGESRQIEIAVEPRLLANYAERMGKWHIAGGRYVIALAQAADAPVALATVALPARILPR